MNNLLSRFRLTDRVAVITTASKGIGGTLALGLAFARADVVLCSQNKRKLRTLTAEIEQSGRRVETCRTDVSRTDGLHRLQALILERFGRVDILVNSAGHTVTKPDCQRQCRGPCRQGQVSAVSSDGERRSYRRSTARHVRLWPIASFRGGAAFGIWRGCAGTGFCPHTDVLQFRKCLCAGLEELLQVPPVDADVDDAAVGTCGGNALIKYDCASAYRASPIATVAAKGVTSPTPLRARCARLLGVWAGRS